MTTTTMIEPNSIFTLPVIPEGGERSANQFLPNKKDVISAIAPQSLASSDPTSSYLVKGTDTITIGDQVKWGQAKQVLFSLSYPKLFVKGIEHPLGLLRRAVDADSQSSFRDAVVYSDLWKSPELVEEAIDLALEAGWYALAVELAQKGKELFPDVPVLQKYARIVAPPKVVDNKVPPRTGINDVTAWLKENGANYRGLWVAIKDGDLVDFASRRSDLEEVIQRLPTQGNIIVVKVPNITLKF